MSSSSSSSAPSASSIIFFDPDCPVDRVPKSVDSSSLTMYLVKNYEKIKVSPRNSFSLFFASILGANFDLAELLVKLNLADPNVAKYKDPKNNNEFASSCFYELFQPDNVKYAVDLSGAVDFLLRYGSTFIDEFTESTMFSDCGLFSNTSEVIGENCPDAELKKKLRDICREENNNGGVRELDSEYYTLSPQEKSTPHVYIASTLDDETSVGKKRSHESNATGHILLLYKDEMDPTNHNPLIPSSHVSAYALAKLRYLSRSRNVSPQLLWISGEGGRSSPFRQYNMEYMSVLFSSNVTLQEIINLTRLPKDQPDEE